MTSVLIVEPVSSGNELVVRAAAMGWHTVVASFDADDRTLTAATKDLASAVVRVDTNDAHAIVEAVSRSPVGAGLDGVVAGSEFHVEIAALVAEKLGLPGLNTTDVALVRNKAEMREALQRAGVPSPRHRKVASRAEAELACAALTFPVVVKPVESSSSIHVLKASDTAEAVRAYAAIEADGMIDLGRPLGDEVVIEEYVSGDEYSADGYVWRGAVHIAAVTRKLLGPEPTFVEFGHITPAPLGPTDLGAIERYVGQVVRAVGLDNSVFHCEVRLSTNGPVLMEIAARLPGDQIVHLVADVTGVSMADAALLMAVGANPETCLDEHAASGRAAGIRFVDPGSITAYTRIEGWDDVPRYADVVERKVLVPAGEQIPSTYEALRRVAYIRYRASDPDTALTINERLGRELRPVAAYLS
ncbi:MULTISPECIES: ATP-grasp domain-containing protein [unclassified Micromonospora]|uniref:ATP-grasp domain-containing protein n=1 Tax=unclassified Micromonospora TaxID=2617518 RepID=UPI003408BB7D